jgi:hypothetical protein
VNATVRNPCQTLKITIKDPGPPVTLTFDDDINQLNSIYNSLKYLKRSRRVSDDVAPGDTEVMLLIDNPADASLFKIGDYVLLSDGVGVVEVFGEYLKIASVTPNTGSVTITFTTGVAGINGATYPAARAVLIPGPWAKGITIRNLQLGGNAHLDPTGGWGIKFAPDFTAENVRNWRGDLSVTAHPFGAGNCVNGLFLNCQFESMAATNSCHDMRFIGCAINQFTGEEWSRNLYFINCEISTYCRAQTNSYGFNFSGCRFRHIIYESGFDLGYLSTAPRLVSFPDRVELAQLIGGSATMLASWTNGLARGAGRWPRKSRTCGVR